MVGPISRLSDEVDAKSGYRSWPKQSQIRSHNIEITLWIFLLLIVYISKFSDLYNANFSVLPSILFLPP